MRTASAILPVSLVVLLVALACGGRSVLPSSTDEGGGPGSADPNASGGHAQGGATQGGLPTGGVTQGGHTQGGAAQGGHQQGGATQGGSTQGGATQGGHSPGGTAQGGTAQGGSAAGSPAMGGEGGSPGCNRDIDCDDDNACTQDTCNSGSCKRVKLNVDDGDACTVDTCVPRGGVTHQPVNIDDGNACTIDACVKGQGVSHTPRSCHDGTGCSVDICDPVLGCKLTDATNLARDAKALTSGGGSIPPFTVIELNNGMTEATDCKRFSWIDNDTSASGAYFELDWPSAVTIGSLYVETAPAGGDVCNFAGRNLSSATVEYWNGTSWVTSTSWTSETDDVDITLPSPVTTTKLRLYDVTSTPGNGNSLIYELYVFPSADCIP